MSWEHLRDTHPRGRRVYQCDLCHLRIRKGAKHVHRVGVLDGELIDSRMHAVCDAASALWAEGDWEVVGACGAEFRRYDLGLPLIPEVSQ